MWLMFTYFCLVGVRLKRDTLRLLPFETILEWGLVSESEGQLGKNTNVGIVLVYSCYDDILIHKFLGNCELVACIIFPWWYCQSIIGVIQ